MVRTKDGDGIKSNLIVAEVQKRPCLFDTNDVYYSDRLRKERSWDEVCECVVPGWDLMRQFQKLEAVREVQKRWRSIRDSYTKAYRQGKCVLPEQCQPGSRRYQYHAQMSFLLRALQNKKPRYSQDKMTSNHTQPDSVQEKYESFSEVSNSPQHPPPEDIPKVSDEKPLDLKTKTDLEKPETVDKSNQAVMSNEKPIEINNPSVEIKIDANSILPDDYFDDDRMFMNSLLPLFKKMNDDTRLLCRIEVLKIIRYLLRGEARGNDSRTVLTPRKTDARPKEEAVTPSGNVKSNGLAVTTRSANGTRPQRKRKTRSPSPLPFPAKRRGPGRPRKVRPPPSDSDEDQHVVKKRCPKMKVAPVDTTSEMDDSLSTATSVSQLSQPLFMKMYNLERSKVAQDPPETIQVSVKTEPADDNTS